MTENVQTHNVPKWLCRQLNAAGLTRISEAVRMAEQTTIGEIVPVVVRRSSPIGHVAPILFSSFLLLFLVVLDLFTASHSIPPLYLFGLLVPSFLGALLLSGFPSMQRFFTAKLDREYSTWMRAENMFYRCGVQKTSQASGIMLFISMMERQAIVLADKTIADKMPKETWTSIVQILIQAAKSHHLDIGFAQAISECSKILSEHFPRSEKTTDELRNELVIQE